MKSKFEEKTYESYFNNELDRKSQIYFPPGQVLEGSLGFDASSLSKNRGLWRNLGHPFWFRPDFEGVPLRSIADEMVYYLDRELDNIPAMKANILFQYKRPEFISSTLGKEWVHWNQPYFRYDIYKEQQDLLSHIHNKFKSEVLVVYASPCTHDMNELVKKRKDIIKNSNFAKAVDLDGHHRNTYIRSGTHSIACSEPSSIQSLNIIETINELGNREFDHRFGEARRSSNRDFLIDFSSEIQMLVNEYKYLSESFKSLNIEAEKVKDYELLYSMCVMSNFRQLTETQWVVKV